MGEMQVILDYGQSQLAVDIPPEKRLPLSRRGPDGDMVDPVAAVQSALESPHEYPPLRSALTPDDHLAIVVDQRLPHVADLTTALLRHVSAAGVMPDAVTLVVPPGVKSQNWIDELPDEFGEVKVETHDPANRKAMAYLATTRSGRRIYLNRTVVDSDQVVVLSGVHFDPSHGYVGSADFVYPALSDVETQRAWQKALTIEPPADEPWPLRREAEEVLWLLGAPFLVQAIHGDGDTIAEVIGGSAESAAAARQALDDRWRASVPRRAELVVATVRGDPSAVIADDLARAMACAARVVAPHGVIVVLSDSRPELGEGLTQAAQLGGPAAALAALHAHPSPDYSTAYQWLRAAEKHRVILLSGLADDDVESLFVTPLGKPHQLQKLIDAAGSCAILPDAHRLLAAVAIED